jgi:uncharacterized membrane protein
MAISCASCGTAMPDESVFCPDCGGRITSATPSIVKLGNKILAAVAYLFLPAIIFLFIKPYKRDQFLRFHGFQAIFFWGAALLTGIALKVAAVILFHIPRFGPLIIYLAGIVLVLAWFILWVVLVLKALQGEIFKLPYIGEMAEHLQGGAATRAPISG